MRTSTSTLLVGTGFTLGLLCCALLTTLSAQARSPAPQSDTAVAVDAESGVVRVMVKGREVAVFNESGLRVAGDLRYSGSIGDTTPSLAPDQAEISP